MVAVAGALRPGPALGARQGWRSCWDPLCHGRVAGCQPTRLRVVVMPPQSPSSTENQWAGTAKQLGPHPGGGTDKGASASTLPTRAAIHVHHDGSQPDAPVGLTMIHVDRNNVLPERA